MLLPRTPAPPTELSAPAPCRSLFKTPADPSHPGQATQVPGSAAAGDPGVARAHQGTPPPPPAPSPRQQAAPPVPSSQHVACRTGCRSFGACFPRQSSCYLAFVHPRQAVRRARQLRAFPLRPALMRSTRPLGSTTSNWWMNEVPLSSAWVSGASCSHHMGSAQSVRVVGRRCCRGGTSPVHAFASSELG